MSCAQRGAGDDGWSARSLCPATAARSRYLAAVEELQYGFQEHSSGKYSTAVADPRVGGKCASSSEGTAGTRVEAMSSDVLAELSGDVRRVRVEEEGKGKEIREKETKRKASSSRRREMAANKKKGRVVAMLLCAAISPCPSQKTLQWLSRSAQHTPAVVVASFCPPRVLTRILSSCTNICNLPPATR